MLMCMTGAVSAFQACGTLHHRPNAADVRMMALPEPVADMVPKAVRELETTEANWNALRACYPTEEAAVAAVKRNLPVILPYSYDGMKSNGAQNIEGSYKVLLEMLGDEEEVLDIITKNPGVLGCVPEALAKSDADEIRKFAGIAAGAEAVFGPARRFLQSLPGWDEGTSYFLEAEERRAELEAERERAAAADMEQLTFSDDETYYFDPTGSFSGIENALLDVKTLDPVGLFDPETDEITYCEFADVDEDDANDEE